MLQHLRECTQEADEELRLTKPPRDGDNAIIAKQATALLLRKNYGKKLTSNDLDCHLYDACTLLTYDEQEEEALRRGDGTASTSTAPKPSVWINDEDDDDGAAQAQPYDGATAPRAVGNARVDTHQASEREADIMPLPKRCTRSRRMSAQQPSTCK